MSELIMLVGLPASGKTTYAELLAKREGFIHLSSDNLRLSMGFGPGEGSGIVFQTMLKDAKDMLIKGKNVVYDATNLTRKHRIHCIESLKKVDCKKKCVIFAESYESCLRRNGEREEFARVPDGRIKEMFLSFQTPMKYEGFDEIEIVRKSATLDPEMYIGESEGFSQDNSHHNLDLAEHMVATEKYISDNYTGTHKELLKIAARYHDIGKLVTKEFKDSKGNPSKDAHYYGHHCAGAYMFLSSNNHLSPEDALYVSALISWHMRPYLEMNEEKRKQDKKLVGDEFYKEIYALHEADAAAH